MATSKQRQPYIDIGSAWNVRPPSFRARTSAASPSLNGSTSLGDDTRSAIVMNLLPRWHEKAVTKYVRDK